MLTPREFQITNKFLTTSGSLRVKDLAKEFQVSARAIQYDLENVKDYLKKRDILICSAPGKGIWTECAADQREAALQELSHLQKGSLYFNQKMRVQRVFLQLLFTDQYTTAGMLAQQLNVSRGTILSDIDHIGILLQDSGLLLERQARQGYRLDGSELALRTLAESLLQEGMTVYDIYQMINLLKSGEPSETCPLPLTPPHDSCYAVIERAMIQAFREKPEKLQKENIIVQITRLLVSVIRMSIGRYVGSPAQSAQPDCHILYPYWKDVYDSCNLPVLQDELDYIQGRYQEEKLPVDVAALSADLVESVSRMENFPYAEDKTLYPRLLTHLRHNFSSDKKATTKNPFHDLILSNHAHLYESISTVCKKHIDSTYLFSNDSFVSYLVLHFLTSQKNLGVGRKMRVVFVCATGRGAAKIIERMLESEIKRLEIVQHCSLTEADEVVEKKKPDFLISVFPIESTVPVIVVEPLPSEANVEAIRRMIDQLTGENELLLHGQTVDLQGNANKQEEISQEVILAGLKIYAKLREAVGCTVKPNMEFAFLAHVMLLANRLVFDKQFSCKSADETPLDTRIKKHLADINVFLTLDEVKALGYYFVDN